MDLKCILDILPLGPALHVDQNCSENVLSITNFKTIGLNFVNLKWSWVSGEWIMDSVPFEAYNASY